MNKKSIIALVLAMVMMMSLLAGCSNGGSKVDSTKTHLSWVALYGMAYSFIELDKAVVHVIRLTSCL